MPATPRQSPRGTRVTLDGSGSTDPEGQTLTYTWTARWTVSRCRARRWPNSRPSTRPRSTARPTTPSPSPSTTVCRTPLRRVSPSRWKTTPRHRSGRMVDDQTEVAHIAMEALVLPLATGGNGDAELCARVCRPERPDAPARRRCPPASALMRSTRTLSGTPTATGTTALIYTVTDADDNAADTPTPARSASTSPSAPTRCRPPMPACRPDGDRGRHRHPGRLGQLPISRSRPSPTPGPRTRAPDITLSDATSVANQPTFDRARGRRLRWCRATTLTLVVNDGVQDSAAANVTITVERMTSRHRSGRGWTTRPLLQHIAMEDLGATCGDGRQRHAHLCAGMRIGADGL